VHRAVGVATGVAVVLALLYLALPPSGTDLSAAVAHAHFAQAYGLHPINFEWYGGTNQYGYSLLSQYVMALTGVKMAGALAAVVGAGAFAALLVASGMPRPVTGGVVGAAFIAGNLVSGRITWALGLAAGLLCLLAVAHSRRVLAGVLAVLSSALSPVAALFLGLSGVALLIAGRRRDGAVVAVAAALPLAVTGLLFGEGGANTISASDVAHAALPALIVAVLVPARVLRIGAVLAAAGVVAAFALDTPVGGNALRLPLMFAVPLLAAAVRVRWLAVTSALLTTAFILPLAPFKIDDVRSIGDAASSRAFFAPLIAELARRAPTGRVEVPPLADYWDSVYVAETVDLGRGWLRQVDVARNPAFFDGSLTADTYRDWIADNGVQYVAIADTQTSWVGAAEARVVRAAPAYLRRVWDSKHWTLYEVGGSPSLVDTQGSATARVIRFTGDDVTVAVEAAGAVLVRVRFSRWLTVSGPSGCLRPRGRWTELEVDAPGTYRLSSALLTRNRGLC
jgi:hypothetical protein